MLKNVGLTNPFTVEIEIRFLSQFVWPEKSVIIIHRSSSYVTEDTQVKERHETEIKILVRKN